MKRTLIFSLAYYPHIGGAEVAVKEITDRLPDIAFDMITLRMAGETREENIGAVRVYRVGNGASYLQKILFIPRASRLASRLHRAHHYDAFWVIMSYMLFPVVLLRWFGIRPPYLLSLQEGDPFGHVFDRLRILPFRPLLASGFKNATAVQTISTFLAGWAKRVGFPGTPQVIGNGVDIKRFTHNYHDEDITLMRQKIGKGSRDIYLVTTSRLVHKNAVDDVIHALTFLPDNIHFFVYGIGPDETKLRKLANKLGVASRTHFGGHIDHDEMPLALRACDIFVRPSRSEGMGNVFVEAMAVGLPVIATQEGGIADFLFDAKRNPGAETTGWAVDKDSPEQIADAVKDILAHPEQVKKVTAIAQRLATENYDWNLIAHKMKLLFSAIFDRT